MNIKIKEKMDKMLAERDGPLPIWVRAPKPGQTEYFTGLGRGKLYQGEASGHIKTASLKPPGAVRGVKLFNLKSVLSYIEACSQPYVSTRPIATHAKTDPTVG